MTRDQVFKIIKWLYKHLAHVIIENEDQLPDLIFWSMGSVSNVTWPQIAIMLAATVVGLVVMTRYAWDLNVMATGEESAIGLGVNYKKIRTIAFLTSHLTDLYDPSESGLTKLNGDVADFIKDIHQTWPQEDVSALQELEEQLKKAKGRKTMKIVLILLAFLGFLAFPFIIVLLFG